MDKKIYVVGLDDNEIEAKINTTISAINGVTVCKATSEKAQVFVTFDETISGIEDTINNALTSCGVVVL